MLLKRNKDCKICIYLLHSQQTPFVSSSGAQTTPFTIYTNVACYCLSEPYQFRCKSRMREGFVCVCVCVTEWEVIAFYIISESLCVLRSQVMCGGACLYASLPFIDKQHMCALCIICVPWFLRYKYTRRRMGAKWVGCFVST